jgi:hypothetical protein
VAPIELAGGQRRDRPAAGRLTPGAIDVGDREGDVVNAVAVGPDVVGDLAVGGERRGEHEPDLVLDHHV